MLVEAFPAAQLRTWALPHNRYSKPKQYAVREKMLLGLAQHLNFTEEQRRTLLGSADALDAAIAEFAAIAASKRSALTDYPADGLIAISEVMRPAASCSQQPTALNLLDLTHSFAKEEVFEGLLRTPGVQIERIVSRGHVTPADTPYLQEWDEWVLEHAGSARLKLAESAECILQAGNHILIPAGVSHLSNLHR